jgi:hypothetical protein
MWFFLGRYVGSHAHRSRFNMHPCWVCGEKLLHHTETGKEKQSKPKTGLPPSTAVWLPQNRFAHIKRENSQTSKKGRETVFS